RQHAGLEDAPFVEALRREGHAPPTRSLARVEARRALVDASDGRAGPSGRAAAGGGEAPRGVEAMKWHTVETKKGTRCRVRDGGSMGGMIAAEMACLAPRDLGTLVLVGAAGLWMDEHPIPDIFAMLPHQIAEVLFADPRQGQMLLTGGADLSDMEALKDFYVASQRRLAMAGKILFPIPNRRLVKRLYRLTAETLVLWGAADRLIVPAYAERWKALLPTARVQTIDGAGHMLPYEQPEAFVRTVGAFLG